MILNYSITSRFDSRCAGLYHQRWSYCASRLLHRPLHAGQTVDPTKANFAISHRFLAILSLPLVSVLTRTDLVSLDLHLMMLRVFQDSWAWWISLKYSSPNLWTRPFPLTNFIKFVWSLHQQRPYDLMRCKSALLMYEVHHIKGISNVIADSLSCIWHWRPYSGFVDSARVSYGTWRSWYSSATGSYS
jgi:hypothetical protein